MNPGDLERICREIDSQPLPLRERIAMAIVWALLGFVLVLLFVPPAYWRVLQ